MMKKDNYAAPRMTVFTLRTPAVLTGSTPDGEERMRWSGDRPGTAGPEEIDDNSTYDAF